jgi:hypothetical protein
MHVALAPTQVRLRGEALQKLKHEMVELKNRMKYAHLTKNGMKRARVRMAGMDAQVPLPTPAPTPAKLKGEALKRLQYEIMELKGRMEHGFLSGAQMHRANIRMAAMKGQVPPTAHPTAAPSGLFEAPANAIFWESTHATSARASPGQGLAGALDALTSTQDHSDSEQSAKFRSYWLGAAAWKPAPAAKKSSSSRLSGDKNTAGASAPASSSASSGGYGDGASAAGGSRGSGVSGTGERERQQQAVQDTKQQLRAIQQQIIAVQSHAGTSAAASGSTQRSGSDWLGDSTPSSAGGGGDWPGGGTSAPASATASASAAQPGGETSDWLGDSQDARLNTANGIKTQDLFGTDVSDGVRDASEESESDDDDRSWQSRLDKS